MSERYNLRGILTNINHSGKSDKINKILIPRIQRAYAQGRKNESTIRDSILDDIFKALRSNSLLELNFVYGTVGNGIFELLDGQQRLTTLFLIHWYVACREERLNEISDYLLKFSYETRHTSADFCEGLARYNYEKKDGQKVSDSIRKRISWYFKSFDLDSTVESMLRMLDSIELKYEEDTSIQLFDNLDNLQFYVLCLDDFKLTDELYIKMNARGLPLTPFENFKADFINYMKDSDEYNQEVTYDGHTAPLYLKIASELDGKWADIFWDDDDYLNIDKNEYDENNEDYSVKYFRFFYRYFAARFVTNYSGEIQGKDMHISDAFQFFYKDSEEQKLDRYSRFSYYAEVLNRDSSPIKGLEKILNTIREHYQKDIKPLMIPAWESDNWDFFSPVLPGGKGFSLQRRIVFSAICDFIEYYDDFNSEELAKVMRVVWNIVENTDVNSVAVLVNLERTFNVMIRNAAISGQEFYAFLSTFHGAEREQEESAGERSSSVKEEIVKAAYISANEEWLPLFIEAEKHSFCRGMLGFFLRQDGTDSIEMFSRRYAYINELFYEKGVAPKYSYEGNHILLRALISKLTNIRNFEGKYFTDESETKYNALRILLSNSKNQGVRDYLYDVLEKDTLEEVIAALETAVSEPLSINIPFDDNWKPKMELTFHRIYNNPNYLKWGIKYKAFRIYCRNGNYYLLEPGTSTNLALLSTHRDEIIISLMNDGWTVVNSDRSKDGKTQIEIFNEYGFFFGNNVVLEKNVNGWRIRVTFSYASKLYVSVYCSADEIQPLVGVYGEEVVQRVKDSDPERYYIVNSISYAGTDAVQNVDAALFGPDGIFTRIPQKL